MIVSYIDAESLKTIRKEEMEVLDLDEANAFILEEFNLKNKIKVYRLGFIRLNGSWQTIDPYDVILRRIQKMEGL